MRLEEKYKKQVIPEMKKIFSYKNNLAVPKLYSITVNVGLNRARTEKDANYIEKVEKSLMLITGQKPVKALAKKSIAGFKIRQGIPVGMFVTLRGKRMYDFLEKLIVATLPRKKDFRGISLKSVDKDGNLSIGLKEQLVFPEVDPEKVDLVHGLGISIRTTAKTREEGIKLLELLGVPFSKTLNEDVKKEKKNKGHQDK